MVIRNKEFHAKDPNEFIEVHNDIFKLLTKTKLKNGNTYQKLYQKFIYLFIVKKGKMHKLIKKKIQKRKPRV